TRRAGPAATAPPAPRYPHGCSPAAIATQPGRRRGAASDSAPPATSTDDDGICDGRPAHAPVVPAIALPGGGSLRAERSGCPATQYRRGPRREHLWSTPERWRDPGGLPRRWRPPRRRPSPRLADRRGYGSPLTGNRLVPQRYSVPQRVPGVRRRAPVGHPRPPTGCGRRTARGHGSGPPTQLRSLSLPLVDRGVNIGLTGQIGECPDPR